MMKKKTAVFLLALSCVSLLVIGSSMAYLFSCSEPVKNGFVPAEVSCDTEEKFDGRVKEDVSAKNTGNICAYLRIKLISYRVDGEDDHLIGGRAEIPAFTPGKHWVLRDGYYYYTLPVEPGQRPETDLIDRIELTDYDDADGGRQVIEVMAEAIQSRPDKAAGEAWGVKIREDSVSAYRQGGEN